MIWLPAVVIGALVRAAPLAREFNGYLSEERNRVYVSVLPDNLALRYEVRWLERRPRGLCFRNLSLHCGRTKILFVEMESKGPNRYLSRARLKR